MNHRRPTWRRWGAALALAAAIILPAPGGVADACHLPEHLKEIVGELTAAQISLMAHGGSHLAQVDYSLEARSDCTDGFADIFPCHNVDLLAHMSLSEIGGGTGNDIWGWYDGETGKEYALVGRSNGTALIDISDPENPLYVANMPTHAQTSAWRDIKVYEDHAFVVADFAGDHGMQVFRLADVRGITNPPEVLTEAAHYGGFERAHNIVVNTKSGFAYAVGTDTCSGGLHMIDIREPLQPSFAGCFSGDGYTHDAHCVTYRGPDTEHTLREICVASNEDTITVVDVTDKSNPLQLSRSSYAGRGYTHQGWFTDDRRFFIQDDELDERNFGHTTKTYVWDMTDLDAPVIAGTFLAAGSSIDHNQYVRGGHTFQANYQRGLRILRLNNPAIGDLQEVAFIDTYPSSDGNNFSGAWSAFPFFRSGIVMVSDINRGLFLTLPTIIGAPLFSDDFDSGDLSRWEKRKGSAVEAVGAGLADSTGALSVDLAAGGGASYLAAEHLPGEKGFSASFLLAVGDARPAGKEVEILQLRDGREVVGSLALERRRGGLRASYYTLGAGGASELVGTANLPNRRAIRLTVEWRRASGVAARDGEASFYRRKKRVGHLSGLANPGSAVTEVRLGLPAQGDGVSGRGRFIVNDYASESR